MPNQVDTSLAPHPTGPAAAFAAAHSADHPLKLYGSWFCPFVQRAWITLHEKAIPHQYIEINPYDKAAAFLALNPRGLVPALAVPGAGRAPLYESTVLCEYLEEAHAGRAPRLLPAADDAYARARARLWADHVCTRIVPAFYRLLQHTPDKAYGVEEARGELLAHVKAWVAEMAPSSAGPWFLGEAFSLVDVMLAPWAKRLFLIDYYKPGGVGIEAAREEDAETWDRWQVWFDAILARPSVRETTSADDKYIEAYKRYAEDTTGSEVGQATRLGTRLP